MSCLMAHGERLVHVHVKDVTADGRWVGLGEGCIDFPGFFRALRQQGYDGWVVAEEESDAARDDGAAAVRRSLQFLRETLGTQAIGWRPEEGRPAWGGCG